MTKEEKVDKKKKDILASPQQKMCETGIPCEECEFKEICGAAQ